MRRRRPGGSPAVSYSLLAPWVIAALGLPLAGVLGTVVGALPGVVGSLMALEAIKQVAGIPDNGAGAGLRGRMLILDGLWGDTRSVSIPPRQGCPVCRGKGGVAKM